MAIKVITNRDRELFRQLARTAIITKQQALQHLNYDRNNRRIENLVKDGYLRKQMINGKTIYRLDDKGTAYVKENIADVYKIYSATGGKSGFQHDYRLTELYYEFYHSHYDALETWRTEQDYKQNGSYGTPDATIFIGEQTFCLEIWNSNYTQAHIESKLTFAEQYGYEMVMHRV
jgi:predicted transcriptional regulator